MSLIPPKIEAADRNVVTTLTKESRDNCFLHIDVTIYPTVTNPAIVISQWD